MKNIMKLIKHALFRERERDQHIIYLFIAINPDCLYNNGLFQLSLLYY